MVKSAVEIVPHFGPRDGRNLLNGDIKLMSPTESIEVLNQLKDRYLLSVITNGNVIATRIGFEHFQLSLRGGEQAERNLIKIYSTKLPSIWCKTE